jgi:hypothetical protein
LALHLSGSDCLLSPSCVVGCDGGGAVSERVFKYGVVGGKVSLPEGAEVISFDLQDGQPFVWALVDDSSARGFARRFWVFATGEPMPDDLNLRHVGSAQERFPGGPFVLHCFEEIA